MRFPNFIGGSYQSQSPRAALERTINFYPERIDTGGAKNTWALYPTPGVQTFATPTVPDTPVRGMFYQTSRCFAVIGTSLYEVFEDGTLTRRGSAGAIATTGDPAYITSNGDGGEQLAIASGDKLYAYDLTTDSLSTARASATTMCAMLDGFILVLDAATSTLFISALNDAATYDPLDFQQRTQAPDRWVSLAVGGTDVWLLGEETSEAWYNAGESFPFVPYPNGLVPYGCAARHSARVAGDNVLWLARTKHGVGQVVMTSGVSVKVVSTQAMTHAIERYATFDDAIAEVYEESGHTFYKLTFPTENVTWCYDLTTGLWHERGYWNPETGAYDADRTLYHAFAFGQHLVGDRLSGTLYTASTDFYTDVNGDVIRRLRRAPVISTERARMFFPWFELDLEVGRGAVAGQGSDPMVSLEYSNDNGQTWYAADDRSAGAVGAYDTQVRWLRLGSARDRVFQVVMTDPVPWHLIDAHFGLRPSADR